MIMIISVVIIHKSKYFAKQNKKQFDFVYDLILGEKSLNLHNVDFDIKFLI